MIPIILNPLGLRTFAIKKLSGKGGGYRLSRAAEEINVLDVLQSADGTIAPVACLEEGSAPCSRAAVCKTLPLWKGLERVVSEYLSGYTIRDLATDVESEFSESVDEQSFRSMFIPIFVQSRS